MYFLRGRYLHFQNESQKNFFFFGGGGVRLNFDPFRGGGGSKILLTRVDIQLKFKI